MKTRVAVLELERCKPDKCRTSHITFYLLSGTG
jgi:translation initiation factor RLI1